MDTVRLPGSVKPFLSNEQPSVNDAKEVMGMILTTLFSHLKAPFKDDESHAA